MAMIYEGNERPCEDLLVFDRDVDPARLRVKGLGAVNHG